MSEAVINFLETKFGKLIQFVIADPGTFIVAFLTYVSPLLILCAVLAWKLQKAIEHEERSERRRVKLSKMLQQQRKRKAD